MNFNVVLSSNENVLWRCFQSKCISSFVLRSSSRCRRVMTWAWSQTSLERHHRLEEHVRPRAKPIRETRTQRQRDIHEPTHTYRWFLGAQRACLEKPLTSLISDGKTQEILAWTLLLLITVTFQQRSASSTRIWFSNRWIVTEVEPLQRWKDRETSLNTCCDSSGACWRRGFRSVRVCQTCLRMSVWVAVNQLSKSWRNRSVQCCLIMYVDYKCNSDMFFLQNCRVFLDDARCCMDVTLKGDGQTSFFKLMSKDYHGENVKIHELIWFRIPAKQLKLAEQW